jgi:hypothetical protein
MAVVKLAAGSCLYYHGQDNPHASGGIRVLLALSVVRGGMRQCLTQLVSVTLDA